MAARSKSKRQADEKAPKPAVPISGSPIPVVALGASAGGLKALGTFFRNVQSGTGMAFVVAMHLSQEFVSQLPQILQGFTVLRVSQVRTSEKMVADNIYVISPQHHLSVRGEMLLVSERNKASASGVIDHLFESLAVDRKERAVGIVFSGSGADGTIGSQFIKEHGGLVLAQQPDEAEFADMPRSVIGAGLADFVLPAADMPSKLQGLPDRSRQVVLPRSSPASPKEGEAQALTDILERLKALSGHDFAHYKRSSLLRQLARRMRVLRIDSLGAYAHRLQTDDTEPKALFRNLLVGVTRFFRDFPAYDLLEQKVLAPLFRERPDDGADPEPVRVWVTGCSTGQEAYSLAMILVECRTAAGSEAPVQILATDIDDAALAVARRGLYPESVTVGLSPERLERFFVPVEGAYRVIKELRDLVVFASHDITRDTPFARIDLLSCRNVLIYFDAEMQKHVLERCAYSLKPGGCLMLGTAEGIGRCSPMFDFLSTRFGLFQRTALPAEPSSFLPASNVPPRGAAAFSGSTGPQKNAIKTPSRGETGMTDSERSKNALILANQEMQSLNEELRSVMEEIEVAKEEMQSLNEELTTVNQELQNKIEEHRRVNSDLHVLIESTQMATLFLDPQLKVQLFTPESKRLFNLLPVDIGRPLADLSHTLTYNHVLADAAQVLEQEAPIEREVQTVSGEWYLMRVMPYQTVEGPSAGVVLTFADITSQKKVEKVSVDRFSLAFHAGPMAASIVSKRTGHFLDVNQIFEQVTGYTRDDLVGKNTTALGLQFGLEGDLALADHDSGLPTGEGGVEARVRTKEGPFRDMVGSSTTIEFGGQPCVLSLFYDVTVRKQLEREILQVSDREQRRIGLDLHDGLGTHLTGVALMARGLARNLRARKTVSADEIDEVAQLVANGVEQARKLAHGLNPFLLEVQGLTIALQELATNVESRSGIPCSFEAQGLGAAIGGDESMHLYRITQEAVNNAVRHAKASQIEITLHRKDRRNRLVIQDDGIGFDTEAVSTTGMGLSMIRYRADMIGASIKIVSTPKGGTKITCRLSPTL